MLSSEAEICEIPSDKCLTMPLRYLIRLAGSQIPCRLQNIAFSHLRRGMCGPWDGQAHTALWGTEPCPGGEGSCLTSLIIGTLFSPLFFHLCTQKCLGNLRAPQHYTHSPRTTPDSPPLSKIFMDFIQTLRNNAALSVQSTGLGIAS